MGSTSDNYPRNHPAKPGKPRANQEQRKSEHQPQHPRKTDMAFPQPQDTAKHLAPRTPIAATRTPTKAGNPVAYRDNSISQK